MNYRTILALISLAMIAACDGPWVLVVNSTGTSGDNNPGDGLCQSIQDPADCTLQAAIDEANAIHNHVSIEIASVGTYFFDPVSDEGLVVQPYGRVIITGASENPALTTIRAFPESQIQSRVFTVRGAVLELYNLTVTGGFSVAFLEQAPIGGAILAESGSDGSAYFLTLENCIVRDSAARKGGGIYASANEDARVLIFDSIIQNNTAFPNAVGGGGGLDSRAGYLGIANTLFEGNVGKQGGAGIAFLDVDSEISGTTFYNNEGYLGAGLGLFESAATLRINRSTFSNNIASERGGGLYVSFSSAEISHVTFTENGALDQGRGIYVSLDSNVDLHGSIIGENYSGGGDEIACGDGSLTSSGYNVLSADIYGPCNFSHNILTDQLGVSPGLASYEAFPIGHHPVETTSAALDAGENLFACEGFDQIGNPTPFDGDNDGMANCDAGAIELLLVQNPSRRDDPRVLARETTKTPAWLEYQRQKKADMLIDALRGAEVLAAEYAGRQPFDEQLSEQQPSKRRGAE